MKKEYIQKLINRYEDGETTLHEEAQLRKYFGRNNLVVPKEWEVYRALFRFEVRNEANRSKSGDCRFGASGPPLLPAPHWPSCSP